MRAEIIAVGTELLLGQLADTNTATVAKHFADAGIDVYATHAVGDNRARITAALRASLERVDGVVTTGGLGPTVDDLTKEAVCEALDLALELHEPSLVQMQSFFARTGRPMRENNRKQAMMPCGSFVLTNPRGTAPGFVAFRSDGKFVASMPGVPREMKPMLTELLVPFLRERYALSDAIYTRVLHTVNLGESEIDHRIDDLFRTSENPKIAVLAHEYRCDVKLMAKAASPPVAEALTAPLLIEIEARLQGHVYGRDDDTLPGVIHALLRENGWRLATAESCTGGRIASALTEIPGASQSFLGGIVAYGNSAKIEQLGVSAEVLARYGAVSEEAARDMARGARARLHADLAVATTGIAGPDGGTAEKPVGLVWFAIDDRHETQAWSAEFHGNREAVMRRATTMALGALWRTLSFG